MNDDWKLISTVFWVQIARALFGLKLSDANGFIFRRTMLPGRCRFGGLAGIRGQICLILSSGLIGFIPPHMLAKSTFNRSH